MTYKESLLDPRWIEKANAIKLRDGNRCTVCNRSDLRLQVHHEYYAPRRMAWEYNDGALITVCDECHKRMGTRKKKTFEEKVKCPICNLTDCKMIDNEADLKNGVVVRLTFECDNGHAFYGELSFTRRDLTIKAWTNYTPHENTPHTCGRIE